MSRDAKQCPWCGRWALKDAACNWVCCGLGEDGKFVVGAGCGMQFCFECSKKLCTPFYDARTGRRIPGARDHHTSQCCGGVGNEDYCPGGHNSHK